MNVLSLFDGMSCGQQALVRAGIKYDKYFASEIDKYAIKVTMANFPETIQLGSVTDVDGYSLPKIDLLIGGSPCQSFSFAGKRKGMSTKDSQEILTLEHYLELKKEQYEFEGQSYLFWEYMRLIKETNPTYFLLENVKMTKKWENVLTNAIGIEPIMINSALVSAQNRKRLYWTNIGAEKTGLFGEMKSIIKQPEDKGILLKDVLQDNPNAIYYMKPEQIKRMLERINVDVNVTESSILDVYNRKIKTDGKCITLLDPKHNNMRLVEPIPVDEKYYLSPKMVEYLNTRKDNFNSGKINYKTDEDKASCINKSSGSLDISDNIIVAMRGRNPENPSDMTTGQYTEQRLEFRKDEKTNCLTSVQKDNLVLNIQGGDFRYDEGFRWRENGKSPTLNARGRNAESSDITGQPIVKIDKKGNIKKNQDKASCFTAGANSGGNHSDMDLISTSKIRKLTPIECERLQTVSDNYTAFVSDSQRYKMLGNGWTIDVIAHIFSYIK